MKNLPDSYYLTLTGSLPRVATEEESEAIATRLAAHGLVDDTSANTVALPLPDAFGTIAKEITDAVNLLGGYRETATSLLAIDSVGLVKPTHFDCQPGWQVWKIDKWIALPYLPASRAMILDTETVLVGAEWLPTCCVCLTSKGVAVWLTDFNDMARVIPFGDNNVIVGHNVNYDRGYLSSEYSLATSTNKYLCTMAMWIVCNGMSNRQVKAYRALASTDTLFHPSWSDDTATSGLDAIYKQMFDTSLDKGVRELIAPSKGTVSGLPWVAENMPLVLSYCYDDVVATLAVFQVLYPRWQLRRPSPVSQIAHTLLAGIKIPLSNSRFPNYYTNVEASYNQAKVEIAEKVIELAEAYYQANPEEVLDDKRSTSLDWTRTHKGKSAPKWLKDIRTSYKRGKLSISQRSSVIILGICYMSELVYWDDSIPGWATESNGGLPHPDGKDKRVTDVFIKDYIELYDSGVLSSSNPEVVELLGLKTSLVNWTSIRKRVNSIKVEPTPDGVLMDLGRVLPSGTITGRCKDNTWLVAPNPKAKRIGTELKSMVQAPEGYMLVGADIDSEEAWLAGILGDSYYGFNGSTPLGFINVAGDKDKGTDLHTLMAVKANLTRDVAKTINYGMLYGQGVKGATNTLQQANPSNTDAGAQAKVFVDGFKGRRTASNQYVDGLASEAFNKMSALTSIRQPKTPLLGAWLSSAVALDPDAATSKTNWIVQASGSDFRDLMVCLVQSFAAKLGIEMLLVLFIHDEGRYLVKQEDTIQAAYILQLAHLYCRVAFIQCLGLDNIPANVAWFSGVDVDTVLRKDPANVQVTPTQQTPIPAGCSLTAQDLMERLN